MGPFSTHSLLHSFNMLDLEQKNKPFKVRKKEISSVESDTPRTEINVVSTYPDDDLDGGAGVRKENGSYIASLCG